MADQLPPSGEIRQVPRRAFVHPFRTSITPASPSASLLAAASPAAMGSPVAKGLPVFASSSRTWLNGHLNNPQAKARPSGEKATDLYDSRLLRQADPVA